MRDWTDEDIVLVSAIEHYSYCPRQCALIYVEKVFDENIFTLRGGMAHERVDIPDSLVEHGVHVEKALPIWSDSYGLQGRADVVEFRADGSVFPIEYKVGPRKADIHDDLQLCAQAICLEEMLGVRVLSGAVFHSSSHQRREVEFVEDLREGALSIVEQVRVLQNAGTLPPPVNDKRCPNCSLVERCMPSGVVGLSELEPARIFIPSQAEVEE